MKVPRLLIAILLIIVLIGGGFLVYRSNTASPTTTAATTGFTQTYQVRQGPTLPRPSVSWANWRRCRAPA